LASGLELFDEKWFVRATGIVRNSTFTSGG
jgi:hypothetical protein